MGLGAIVFGLIGAFVRWSIKGFKGTFKETWDGPEYDDPADGAAYEITNNVIGAITLAIICFIIIFTGC